MAVIMQSSNNIEELTSLYYLYPRPDCAHALSCGRIDKSFKHRSSQFLSYYMNIQASGAAATYTQYSSFQAINSVANPIAAEISKLIHLSPLIIMSIATRRDNPSVNNDSENFLDANEETFDTWFHINCPKCYHMHKHVPLRVHKNSNLFTRFDCQNCHHKIAGIGRNETQSSFASTETQPLEASLVRPSRLSNLQSCINADQLNSQPGGVDKAGSTIPSSPSGLKCPEPGLPPHQDFHTHDTHARSQASLRNGYSLREASSQTNKPLSTIKLRLVLKLQQGKIHLLKKSKNMKLFVSRFWKRETPPPPSVLKARAGPVPFASHSDIRDFQHRPREGEILVQPQGDHPSTPPPASERRPSSVEEQLQARARKDDRLGQRRREATLRRNVFRRPVCYCGANCACVRRDSVGIGAGSDSRSTSRRPSLEQIDAIADNLAPNLLDNIYNPRHLSYPRELLENNALDSLLENSIRSHVRLSQATTVGSAVAS